MELVKFFFFFTKKVSIKLTSSSFPSRKVFSLIMEENTDESVLLKTTYFKKVVSRNVLDKYLSNGSTDTG